MTGLDLCCGAGLARDGYLAVGILMDGVDVEPQPSYPGTLTQADALDVLDSDVPEGYDVLHTSFPCQPHTRARHLRAAQGGASRWPDVLTPGLDLLRRKWSHKPWVVENVEDAGPLMQPEPGETLVRLCGSTFGLACQRHRLFLSNVRLRQPTWPTGPDSSRRYGCRHDTFPIGPKGRPKPVGVYHVPGDRVPEGGHTALDAEHARQVMGSHRSLTWAELKEGFPPAYASHVGADLLRALW